MLPFYPHPPYDDETDDWSSPEGRRRFEYKMTVDTWQIFLQSTTFNSRPYCLISRMGPARVLDDELERIANERALFGAFTQILDRDDLELWNHFGRFLLSPVRRADGSEYPSNPDFVSRVFYHASFYTLGERPYPEVWRKRIADYLTSRWPEYKGQYINVALLEEWDQWKNKRELEKIKAEKVSIPTRIWREWVWQKYGLIYRSNLYTREFENLMRKIKNYWKALMKD